MRSKEINTAALSCIFKNKAESYKLFWLKAILSYVERGDNNISFNALINEMIADAWYMVTEYHFTLGPKDNLKRAVEYIARTSTLKSNSKKEEIIQWLECINDEVVIDYKKTLIKNVPYRFQAPFLGFDTEDWKGRLEIIGDRVNNVPNLIYYFSEFDGLNTKIIITREWLDYLQTNMEILQGWLVYNFVIYLQKRNPDMFGILDQLIS